MRWWPFSKKASSDHGDKLHIKGTKVWLDELREVCEKHHDMPEAGRSRVREMQIEWKDAHKIGDLDEILFQGLERRAFQLTRSSDAEWLSWLADEDFWKPGWRTTSDEP